MRILYQRILEDGVKYIKAAGKSTETPPTDGIATGSQYAQVDAGVIQMFEETDGEWHNFAKFDTGADAVGSLSATRGGSNPVADDDPQEPAEEEPEEPAEGEAK